MGAESKRGARDTTIGEKCSKSEMEARRRGGLVGHTCHYTLSRDRRPKQNLNSKYLAFAPKWIMWTTTSKSIEIFKNLYSYIYREHQFFLFSTIILGKKILYLFLIYLDRCLSDWSWENANSKDGIERLETLRISVASVTVDYICSFIKHVVWFAWWLVCTYQCTMEQGNDNATIEALRYRLL